MIISGGDFHGTKESWNYNVQQILTHKIRTKNDRAIVEPNLGFGTIEDVNQVIFLSQIILMLSPDPYFYQINPFLSIFEGFLVFLGDWIPVMPHFFWWGNFTWYPNLSPPHNELNDLIIMITFDFIVANVIHVFCMSLKISWKKHL